MFVIKFYTHIREPDSPLDMIMGRFGSDPILYI